jgi:hypothetical protein
MQTSNPSAVEQIDDALTDMMVEPSAYTTKTGRAGMVAMLRALPDVEATELILDAMAWVEESRANDNGRR